MRPLPMRPMFALLAVLILASCGVDGAPVAPKDVPEAGLTVSGEARFGVTTP